MEKKYSQKQMENAVMLAAGLYQRLYNESGIKGSSLDVAMTIIHEACKMEEWITEKYGEDDEEYLDRLEEYEKILAERYDLAEPKDPEQWQQRQDRMVQIRKLWRQLDGTEQVDLMTEFYFGLMDSEKDSFLRETDNN